MLSTGSLRRRWQGGVHAQTPSKPPCNPGRCASRSKKAEYPPYQRHAAECRTRSARSQRRRTVGDTSAHKPACGAYLPLVGLYKAATVVLPSPLAPQPDMRHSCRATAELACGVGELAHRSRVRCMVLSCLAICALIGSRAQHAPYRRTRASSVYRPLSTSSMRALHALRGPDALRGANRCGWPAIVLSAIGSEACAILFQYKALRSATAQQLCAATGSLCIRGANSIAPKLAQARM